VTDYAIRVDHASKRFRLYKERRRSLKEVVVTRSFGNWDDFWALQDVSFEIPEGQSVGVIGHNGSGKSTLLKMLTGIIDPDAGSVNVRGRVSSLLELAAGFQPEYTGRENVFLYGGLLGLSRKSVAQKFDEILEFSELGSFIEYPVKNYSSGMYMRLGFSVAVHLDPDVLLIDEVLAVGDANFQQKCFQHLNKLRRGGITIVLVSHDLDSVGRFCERAIWLDQGRVLADGPSEHSIQSYIDQSAARASRRGGEQHADGSDADRALDVTAVRFRDREGREIRTARSGEPLEVEIAYEARRPLQNVAFNLTIFRSDGIRCVDAPSNVPTIYELPPGPGVARLRFSSFPLHRGAYQVTVAVYDPTDNGMFQFHDRLYPITVQDPKGGPAVVWLDYDWTVDSGRARPGVQSGVV
jgi:lipopolysaccharide transport system ATP-binding protein